MNRAIKNVTASVLLFIIILAGYTNSFNASWHLDDYPNILENPRIHLTEFSFESIINTFYASFDNGLYQGKKMYRPVPCFTFALNWYFGGDNVFGYHVVNFSIHFLTAFILFLTVFNLFETPNLKSRFNNKNQYYAAFITAVLWAVNPIQTQAVTYIVQRMASMGAMFYILGFYFYIKARNSNSLQNRVFFFLSCLMSYLLALGSKENTVILPMALLLAEIVFFQDTAKPETRKRLLIITGAGAVLILIIGGLFLGRNPLSVIGSYEHRTFTLFQRIMTQPRILLLYLSQIFYPVPGRLSIEHDIAVSTSLFQPWTTIPAILTIIFLIGAAVILIKERPVVSFAIFFFFLNHVIESSVIALELVFEHRNYLPSMFLFFPVSLGMLALSEYYRQKNLTMFVMLISFMLLLTAGSVTGTYIRNMDWASEKTLWEDAMNKAPGRVRPLANLATEHYKKIGDYDKALELYNKALTLKSHKQDFEKRISILNNTASIWHSKGEYGKAAVIYKQILSEVPGHINAHYNIILSLMAGGKWNEALHYADVLVSRQYIKPQYWNIRGLILLNQEKPDQAFSDFEKALEIKPGYWEALFNTAVSLSMQKKYNQADTLLNRTNKIRPENILNLLYLIENSLKMNDKKLTLQYIEKLFASFSIIEIKAVMNRLPGNDLYIPFSNKLLMPAVQQRLEKES